jgi:hypothetical protein
MRHRDAAAARRDGHSRADPRIDHPAHMCGGDAQQPRGFRERQKLRRECFHGTQPACVLDRTQGQG